MRGRYYKMTLYRYIFRCHHISAASTILIPICTALDEFRNIRYRLIGEIQGDAQRSRLLIYRLDARTIRRARKLTIIENRRNPYGVE